MTLQPRPQPASRRLARLALAAVVLVVGTPSAAIAAEGLQIVPTGFAENFAEHGFLALFYMRRFWMLVLLFAVLAVILNRFAFTPLLRVIEERERRMGGARSRAAELAAQTEGLLGRHADALRQARERAQGERQRLLEEARDGAQEQIEAARGDAERQTQEARREVDAALERARGTLRTDAEQIAEVIADRLLGASPT